MRTNNFRIKSLCFSTGVLVLVTAASARGDDLSSVGVTRITDSRSSSTFVGRSGPYIVAGHQSFKSGPVSATTPLYRGDCGKSCGKSYGKSCGKSCGKSWGGTYGDDDGEPEGRCCLKSCEQYHKCLKECIECKFGYFCHQGCCGKGCPHCGSYDMLYSANPEYFDPRDGRLYSAQGFGMPVAVPLAPNVENQYNYGWGIPSSRLTPISTIIPQLP